MDCATPLSRGDDNVTKYVMTPFVYEKGNMGIISIFYARMNIGGYITVFVPYLEVIWCTLNLVVLTVGCISCCTINRDFSTL